MNCGVLNTVRMVFVISIAFIFVNMRKRERERKVLTLSCFTPVANGNFEALCWNDELHLILFPLISQPLIVFLFKTALCLASPSGNSLSMVKENNT